MYLTLCGNNDTVLILSLLTEIKCNSASDSFTTLALYKFTYLLTYLLTYLQNKLQLYSQHDYSSALKPMTHDQHNAANIVGRVF